MSLLYNQRLGAAAARGSAEHELQPTCTMKASFDKPNVLHVRVEFHRELAGRIAALTNVSLQSMMRFDFVCFASGADGRIDERRISGDTPLDNDLEKHDINGGWRDGAGGAHVVHHSADGRVSWCNLLFILSGEPEYVVLKLRFDGDGTMVTPKQTVENTAVIERVRAQEAERHLAIASAAAAGAQELRARYAPPAIGTSP